MTTEPTFQIYTHQNVASWFILIFSSVLFKQPNRSSSPGILQATASGRIMKILLNGIHQLTRPPSVLVDLKYLSEGILARRALVSLKRSYISITLHLLIRSCSHQVGETAMRWSAAKTETADRPPSSNAVSAVTVNVWPWVSYWN